MFPFKITLVKKLNCKVTEVDLPIVMEMIEEFVADNGYRKLEIKESSVCFKAPMFMTEWGYRGWQRYKYVEKGEFKIVMGEHQSELHFQLRLIYPWLIAGIVALFFAASNQYMASWGAMVILGLVQWLIFLSYQNGWRNDLSHQIERMIKLKYDVARREHRMREHP